MRLAHAFRVFSLAALFAACGGRFSEVAPGDGGGGGSSGDASAGGSPSRGGSSARAGSSNRGGGTSVGGSVGVGGGLSAGGTLGIAGGAAAGGVFVGGFGGVSVGGGFGTAGAVAGTGGCVCPTGCAPGLVPVPNPNGCCFLCVAPPDSCAAQRQQYAQMRDQIIEKYSYYGCMTDADCSVYYDKTSCSPSCGYPMPYAAFGELDMILDSVAQMSCGPSCGPGPVLPCAAPQPPQCLEGRCSRLL